MLITSIKIKAGPLFRKPDFLRQHIDAPCWGLNGGILSTAFFKI